MDLLKSFAVPLAAAIAAAAVPSTAFAQATGNGLIAEYYNTNNFTGAVALTQANQGPINFAYGNAAPAAGVNVDNFSVRWRGELEAPSTETYTFFTTQDDQCRLYIDGALILTNTAVNVEQSATFNLVAGQHYAILIEFIEFGGGAGVAVRWSSPVTTAKDFIPLNRLYSPVALPAVPTFSPDGGVLPLSVSMTAPAAGTSVFYTLDGSDPGLSVPGPSARPFTAPVSLAQSYVRVRARAYGPRGTPSDLATSGVFMPLLDPIALPAATVPGVYARYYHLNNPQVLPAFEPLFPQRRGVLANVGITLTPARDRGDQFGFKLTGFVNIPAEGVWTFTSGSDDGSKLYLHAHEVVSNDGLHGAPGPTPAGSVALKAGWHPITVTMFENGGGEGLAVQWQGPGVPAAAPIPDANLATEPAAAVPSAVPAGGTFAASQLVTLNAATPGAAIYYTLDGSPPDPRATGAVGATGLSFTVTSTTRVRALAVAPGLQPSDVLDVTFTKTVPPGPKYASLTAAGVATRAVVEFDRPVGLAAAGNPANYAINNGATVSAAVPLTKAGALRAYWKFDETAGPAVDGSGNGNAGTYVGSPTPDAVNFATLPFGNATSLAFDGVDDLVQAPHSASLDLADKNFTISLWIRPSTTGTAQALINHYNIPTAERGWRVDINAANGGGLAAGNVWVRLRDGTDTAEASLGAGLTAGVWQHLAIRVERARNRFTVMRNGGTALVNDFTPNVRRRIDMNPRPLQIGAIQNAAGTANERFFSGSLDDVRIYATALSDDEMRALAGGHDTFATAVRLTTSDLNPATLYTMTTGGVQDLAGAAIDPSVASRPFRFYPAGTITNEQYQFDPNGAVIGNARVQDLVRNASFPNNPSGATRPTLFETPTNVFENYGGRVRGWLLPAASGWYRLSLATDDGGMLFVSPNDDPTNKALQSFCWEWTGVRTYVDPEVAQSPAIQLTAGERYYVELLFKEGGGGDNAAVAMIPLTGPTDPATVANAAAPIAGALLAPFIEPPVITVQPRSFVLMPGQPLLLTVDVSGSGPRTYQWRKDGAPINGAATSRFAAAAVAAADAGTYTVVVTCGTDTVTSADAVVTVVAPPAPTLTAAVPVSGPVYGAQAVELAGTNLLFDVTSLRFGGTAATEIFSFAGGTRAIVRTPPHAAGLVEVAAATPGGAGAAPGAFTYYGPPTLTAAAPDAGPIAGGQSVTVSGANFVPGQTQVFFDGVAATSVVVSSFTTLTASTPAHAAGTVAVTVTTPHGTATLAAGYIYFDPPTLTAVAPAHGPVAGGQAVALTGTVFVSGRTTVAFDSTSIAIGALSPTQIEVVSPAHAAGLITITVTTPGGVAMGAYVYHDPPTIATVAPAAGPVAGGQSVTISGAHYVPDQTTVAFGGAAATVVTTLSGSVEVVTPARPAGPVSVVLTTPGGTVTALSAYRYHDPPTLTTVSPSSGPSVGGATLTLTGTNFVPGQTTVSFSGTPGGAVVAPAGTSLTVTTPPRAAGPANVVVTTPGGAAALAGAYVYHDAPTIAAVSPGSGSTQGGQTVTISGTNFAPGETAVLFGGTAGTNVIVDSPGSLSVVSPVHATGTVDVVVQTPGGAATTAAAYVYAGPFIASVSPVAGPVAGGQTVTLAGTGFVPGSTALEVDGAPVVPVTLSTTSLTFVSPPGAGSGAVDVAVTTPDGTYVAAGGYAYVGFPSISVVSPARGPASGGATLVVDGADFAPGNMTVTVGGAAAAIVSSTVVQVVVTTPAHAAGAVDVVVTTFGNQPATAPGAYTYVDAPVVASIVPDRGSTAGGQPVVIRGQRFEPGETSVALGGAPATSVVVDPDGTRLTAVTTARAPGLVHVVVTTFGLQSGSRPGGYTYVDPSTAADLALAMSVDDPSPALGQEVVFTLSLSNSGQVASPGTRVSDPLPAGLAFVSAVASQGAYDPGGGEWTVGTLAAAAGATLSIVARVESSGLLVNTAEVSASSAPDLDSTPGNGVPEEDDRAEIALTAALAIGTDAAWPSATSGARYALRLAASGGRPPYRWTFVSGTLPFHLDPLTGDASGVAPEIAVDTAYAFTLRVEDAEDPPATVTRDFSLTSHPSNEAAPTIRGVSPSPAGSVGAAFFHSFTAVDGLPPYAWQIVAGAPPPGLFLDARGGRLAGAPSAAGSFTFTLRARDARAVDSALPVTVHILANPCSIGPAEVVEGAIGSPYAQALELFGGVGPGFAWTVSAGALPDGLALTGTGRHAEIAGTPAEAGPFAFTVRAGDGGQAGLAATRSYILTIAGAGGTLGVVPRTLPPGTAGVAYAARLTATGGSGPPAWSLVAGSLPAGLALNATTGVISGVPAFAGDVRFVAAAGPSASAGFDLRVAPAPLVVATAAPPFGVVGEAYYLQLRALGGVAPHRWAIVGGSLPAGLSLDAAAGTLQGVPTGAGTVFTLEARDAREAAASASFTLNVLNAGAGLAALGSSPRWGEVGVPYSDTLVGIGGTPPYAWFIDSGALPAWSGFTASTGTVAGLPDAPGRVLFAAGVEDAAVPPGTSTSGTLALDIFDPLRVETAVLPGAVEGTPYAHALSATGVAAPARWRVVSGPLPDGFSLDATSGVLGGTTAGLGVRAFRVEVSDATGRRATRTLSIATTRLQAAGSSSGSECAASAGGAGGLGWIWAAAALAVLALRGSRKEAR